MRLEQLNIICRQSTRHAFEEFKRQIEVALFPFDDNLKINLQHQMLEQLRQGVMKAIFKENTLTKKECRVLNDTLNQYSLLVLSVSNNYAKRFYSL